MAKRYPVAYENVAREVAASWEGGSGNFVVVAPPLTEPGRVFKLLRDSSFIEGCHLDPDAYAIAYMPPELYRNTGEFVQRVLELWEVDVDDADDANDRLELIDEALEVLEEQGRTPVVLLPQFHKTIEKLTWALGARLREMEISYGLCTVVELPVPLSQLRERWEVIEGKETFICSDFGQGHSMILLTGFTRDEIDAYAQESDVDQGYVQKIQYWSGGIPSLVRWLMREAKRAESVLELEKIARRGSVEQSKRFLGWLDAPGTDSFKRHLSTIWLEKASEGEREVVREHDWKDILLDGEGRVLSATIGFACANSFSGGCNKILSSIATAVTHGKVAEVNALVESLSDGCREDERLKLMLLIIPVWSLASGLSPDWARIEIEAKKSERQLKRMHGVSVEMLAAELVTWREFAKEIRRFTRIYNDNENKGWRLADCLSGRAGGGELAAVQLVLYRLHEANKISDPNAALKSVLEIPEQILQIYCGRKLRIPVWEAPELEEEDINSIQALWKEGDYRAPRKNTRLGFSDLLFIGWVRMSHLDQDDRLFNELSDIIYWRDTYDSIRNHPSHSITFETTNRWNEFYSKSLSLADQLAKSLNGKSCEEILPRLDKIITSIAT